MAPSRNVTSNKRLANRRSILKSFKIRGLTLQTSACDAILNILKREDPAQHQTLVHSLADEIKERSIRNNSDNYNIVSKDLVTELVAEHTRNETDIVSEALQLLNAFEMPRLKYDVMRRQFHLFSDSQESRSIYGDANHKIDMFIQRFAMIQQRLLRQECFRPKLVSSSSHTSSTKGAVEETATTVLTPVESLLGRSGFRNLLGIIVQVEEGKYYLEDLSGQIELNFSQAQVLSDGLIGENCVVLVEGETQEGVLFVHKIGSPLPESREKTIECIGIQKSDFFGAFSSEAEMQKLYQQEVENGEDTMFVTLSDVHLDKPQVLTKLEQLFAGFIDFSPLPVFIFMGNFTSRPIRAARDGGIRQAIGYYEQLGKLISKFPKLAKEARFVFIPGPHDPGVTSGTLPHPPIPAFFTSGIKKYVTHAVFASNPCRIRFFTREFVFFRNDIVGKLRNNCIINPRSDDEGNEEQEDDQKREDCIEKSDNKTSRTRKTHSERLIDHAIQTILDQGHLCPLPLVCAPIFWQYDHALRLYPVPDALVVGDGQVDQFNRTCVGCDVMNPGSFASDFNFVVYTPVEVVDDMRVRSNVELSQID